MLSLKKVTLGIASMALVMLGQAVPANAMNGHGNYAVLGCSHIRKEVEGRVVYLWNCDNSYHAEIVNASEGDLVYLKGDEAGKTAYATVPGGSTRVNTRSVGPDGGPWHACGVVNDRNAEVCT